MEAQLCVDITQPLILCYEKLLGEVFYRLKKDIQLDEHYEKTLLNVTDIQKYFGLYDSIEILRIPRKSHMNVTLYRKIYRLIVGLLLNITKNYR